MNVRILKIVAGLLLLIAVFELPYGYYQFLRIAIFVAMIFFAYMELQRDKSWDILVYAVIGILLNPIYPIYLTRSLWFYIDLAAGIALLLLAFLRYTNTKNTT